MTKDISSNSKRLVKNTAFMYARMIFLMIISLYTSRIVLQKLGVDDYGIYNVVGSIVAMFVSLKAMFAGSTQRFLNYEMGSGHPENLQTVYNTSTLINVIIAIIFIILVEFVGLWFLTYKINIAADRLFAAHCVFQFSVVTTFINIISIPLDACIIAHERMDFYAYISIFEGIVKLGICYLLSVFDFDRLILYGFLLLMISIVVRIVNIWFCKRNFKECYLTRTFNKDYFIRMTSFAGWAFFGNTSFALSQSGLNMVLNIFGGPIVNAARGITYQVTGALSQLTNNITIVVKPYVVKTYAGGQVDNAMRFSFLSSKIYFTIQLLLVIVITFFTEPILQLWLGQVPEYAVVFLNLVMLHTLVKSLHMPIDTLFSGKGDIKYYELAEGIILFLPVPITYLLLYLGYPFYTAFVSLIFIELLHIFTISIIAKYVCGLPLSAYFRRVIRPCILCSIVYAFFYWISSFLTGSLLMMILNAFIAVITTLLLMFFFGLSKEEKNSLLSLVKRYKKQQYETSSNY